MRTSLSLIAATLALSASTAYANNATIEKALSSRPDLSTFYEGLVSTGVLAELRPDVSYTVFAPTNEAMARMTPEKYPCFYSPDCRAQTADILRNHIVPQQVTFNGPTNATVFSIDRAPVSISEPNKGYFTADGYGIVSQYQLNGGVLYKLNGVITSPQELANLLQPRVIAVPVADARPGVLVTPVPGSAVATTVTEKVYYSPDGRPDGVSQTTVINATDAYSAAPAR